MSFPGILRGVPLPESQIVGKPGRVVKGERGFAGIESRKAGCQRSVSGGARVRVNLSATAPLGIVSLLLTPQVPKRRIPATFPDDFPVRGNPGSRIGKRSLETPAGAGSSWSLPK
jgi:hypothetical protein